MTTNYVYSLDFVITYLETEIIHLNTGPLHADI